MPRREPIISCTPAYSSWNKGIFSEFSRDLEQQCHSEPVLRLVWESPSNSGIRNVIHRRGAHLERPAETGTIIEFLSAKRHHNPLHYPKIDTFCGRVKTRPYEWMTTGGQKTDGDSHISLRTGSEGHVFRLAVKFQFYNQLTNIYKQKSGCLTKERPPRMREPF